MDLGFISKYNIDNIFESINAYIVKTHDFNLANEKKYRKIIKKLSKTVFSSLNNSNNEKKKNIMINDFNSIVLNKSIPFLLKEIEKDRKNVQSEPVKSILKKTEPVGTGSITNVTSQLIKKSVKPVLEKKTKTKNKKKKKNTNKEISGAMSVFDSIIEDKLILEDNDNQNDYDKFLKNQQNHTKQLKEASLKIKNNFKALTEKRKTDNDIFGNKNLNAFEQIIEEKIEEKKPDIDREAYKSAIDLSLEGYDKAKINETITKVMINQKDYSKNDRIQTYEGEKYMGNLIKPIGEQAPIQPLLYQNSGKGSERIIKKSFVVDSGNIGGTTLSSVTNMGLTNQWTKFKVSMIDTIQIDKLCDLYLRSVSIFNPKIILNNLDGTENNNGMCFTIDIDEINLDYNSNNENLKDKIVINNSIIETITTQRYLNINYPTQAYYIGSLNPSKLSTLTITLGDQNGTTNTIFNSNNNNNRIILSFEIVLRGEVNELF